MKYLENLHITYDMYNVHIYLYNHVCSQTHTPTQTEAVSQQRELTVPCESASDPLSIPLSCKTTMQNNHKLAP